MKEQEYINKKNEIAKKFQYDFIQDYHYDDCFRAVLEALIRDADPYYIIE